MADGTNQALEDIRKSLRSKYISSANRCAAEGQIESNYDEVVDSFDNMK
jgi:hypothetical protein